MTYIEPFVGGGAMLFYMLTHYPNIKRAIINDVNEDLINCYLLIKNDPEKLITSLREIKDEYYRLATIEAKSQYYYQTREKYNNEELAKEKRAACFIFLNKSCIAKSTFTNSYDSNIFSIVKEPPTTANAIPTAIGAKKRIFFFNSLNKCVIQWINLS